LHASLHRLLRTFETAWYARTTSSKDAIPRLKRFVRRLKSGIGFRQSD
jgi:hypothetical protein